MYKLRLKILLVFFALAFVVVLVRLVDMQLICGQKYRDAATRSREKIELLPDKRSAGQRGRILDRNDVILAEDRPCHDFCLQYQFIVSDPKWVKKQIRLIAAAENLDMKVDFEADQAREIYNRRAANTWKLARTLADYRGEDLNRTVSRIKRSTQRWQRALDRRGGGMIAERTIPRTVVTGLDAKDVALYYTQAEKIAGGSLIPCHTRVYPQGDIASHIIGVTGPVFQSDLRAWNLTAGDLERESRRTGQPMRQLHLNCLMHDYFATDSIGKMGVEKAAELQLRPKRGYRLAPRPGEISQQVAPTPGRDVKLTIDIELQRALTKLLVKKGVTGSIVVISVNNREILAMVSVPTYDLNTYRRNYNRLAGIVPKLPDNPTPQDRRKHTLTAIAATRSRTYLPLLNRAVVGFPPGSTVKPIVALAGLADGKISTASHLECTGKNTLARNGKPRCWIYRAKFNYNTHGFLNVIDALKVSCNIFFVKVGNALGHKRLCHWLGKFGFGEAPYTGLPEERRGVIGSDEWLRTRPRHPRRAAPSDTWYMSIGQGVFTASVLQVANAMATVAAGGEFISPLLIRRRIDLPLVESRWNFVKALAPEKREKITTMPKRLRYDLGLSHEHVQAVHNGMYKVVNEGYTEGTGRGTAYRYWREAGPPLRVKVCGKTGTAQAPPHKIDTNDDNRRDTIVRKGSHAWFTGFGPAYDPKIAIAVIVEYAPEGGGACAAPVGKEVFRICEKMGYMKK